MGFFGIIGERRVVSRRVGSTCSIQKVADADKRLAVAALGCCFASPEQEAEP